MARLYLVRHAQTSWNAQGRIQGHSESHLEAAGLAQAQLLARRLEPVSFEAAYSSDMSRTRATAEAVLRGRPLRLETTSELRELSYGKWEGMTRQEIKAAYPGEFAEYMKGDVSFIPPGGESPAQLLGRLAPVVDRLRSAHPDGKDILVVSHGGTLRGLLILLMGLPPELFWRFNVAHAGVSVVSTYTNGATLDRWNDTSHLDGAGHA